MTKVNGYRLLESMKRFELQRDSAESQFNGALHCFDGETKDSPDSLMASLVSAESAIASLQTAQAAYNLKVKVQVQGTGMTLCNAIKLMGGATRAETLWKVAAGTKKSKNRYYDANAELVRNADQIHARAVMTPKGLLDRANKASTWSAALRSAVAQGNAVEIELDLDPKLLSE